MPGPVINPLHTLPSLNKTRALSTAQGLSFKGEQVSTFAEFTLKQLLEMQNAFPVFPSKTVSTWDPKTSYSHNWTAWAHCCCHENHYGAER